MMAFLEAHFNELVLLPSFSIGFGECENPTCGRTHWRLEARWLFWSAGLQS